MLKFFSLNLIATFLFATLLSGCNNKKENFDIDLSNFKVPKKAAVKEPSSESLESSEIKQENIENKLINYQDKSKILNSIAFGKKDPFSIGGIQQNKLTSDFQLTGFINTKNDKYIFVNYLGKEGTITEGSIGGINTNLLPDGAKVINIDSKKMNLTINFENEDFIFKL